MVILELRHSTELKDKKKLSNSANWMRLFGLCNNIVIRLFSLYLHWIFILRSHDMICIYVFSDEKITIMQKQFITITHMVKYVNFNRRKYIEHIWFEDNTTTNTSVCIAEEFHWKSIIFAVDCERLVWKFPIKLKSNNNEL